MKYQFTEKLRRPAMSDKNNEWAFLILPKSVSAELPRRGRITVEGTINDHNFQALLEPDGKLSHWLRVDRALLKTIGAQVGDIVSLEITPIAQEPEAEMPSDLKEALASAPGAQSVWNDTTTIARLDWIHWINSAKKTKTREKRINDTCEMLAAGKRRVCCFDQSGFYSNTDWYNTFECWNREIFILTIRTIKRSGYTKSISKSRTANKLTFAYIFYDIVRHSFQYHYKTYCAAVWRKCISCVLLTSTEIWL